GIVNVTCRTLSGSGLGARGYGLVTLDPGPLSLTTQSGGAKTITGTVYVVGGVSLSGCAGGAACGLTVKRGNIYQEPNATTHACPAQDPNLKLTPPYRWICPPTVLRP